MRVRIAIMAALLWGLLAVPPALTNDEAVVPMYGDANTAPNGEAFGLDGYCPVSLIEQQQLRPSQREWTKGDQRWGARHEGRVYLFVGPEEQRKFLNDPARYAPISAGCDVVLATDRDETVAGHRDHGVFYKGHVYLFANEETLRHFSKDPQKYGAARHGAGTATIWSGATSDKPPEWMPPRAEETNATTRTARRGRLRILRRLRR